MKPDINLAHDVFRRARHPLDPFFKPRSVAVIGATETPGSVGRTVLANLVATPFGGAGSSRQPAPRHRARHQGVPERSREVPGRSIWRSS